MNRLLLFWDLLPALTGAGMLIAWLASGYATPWMVGWEISLPLLALVPLWADVATHARAVEEGKKTWKNYPGTCYVVMTMIIVVWSLGFVAPGSVLSNADVCGPVPDTCVDGVLQMTEGNQNCLDIAKVEIDMQDTTPTAQLSVSTVYSNCWDCSLRRIYFGNGRTPAHTPDAYYIPTAHSTDVMKVDVYLPDTPEGSFTTNMTDNDFRDQGIYRLMVNAEQKSITITKIKEPWNYAAPLLILVTVLIVLQLGYTIGNKVAGYMQFGVGFWEAVVLALPFWRTVDVGRAEEGEVLIAAEQPKKSRILALDIFRGISLVIMNMANYGGFGYWFLDHSKWDGLTVADLVFPWFVWIMGVAMAITLEGRRVKENRYAALIHVIRRAALLVLIGILLDTENMSKYSKIRVPGVLQRFGLSYLTVAMAILYIPKRSANPTEKYQPLNADDAADTDGDTLKRFIGKWADPTLREAPIFLTLAAVWIGVSLGTSFTRSGEECKGYLGPGGISQMSGHFNCTGGTANYLDRKMFGTHVWGGCFPCDTYMNYDVATMTCEATDGHDPEGFLGSLNSIVLCWLGLITGRIIAASKTTPNRKYPAISMGLFGGGLCLLAAGLAGFKQFGGTIPINKNLWSTSFVSLMGGTGALCLLVLLVAVDWLKLWNGKPFLFVGMNSILYYSMHEIMNYYIPFASTLDANDTHASLTISNSLGVATNVVIVYWLYRSNLFLKI
eukprot:TRINITY_DN17103_c0_g1_i1.p1 TRINITY_DN17103_c0_g1~~TRINITY_DN17103_c0_g1_i1.p1  ORF type:complete len:753 (+),score=148.16 TRINITY_DN17103_c0_g1_i1:85-2259(+)